MADDSLEIELEPRGIAACTQLPPELEFMGQALQHQVDVFTKARDHSIIVDSAPTGTGKTQAALSVLLHQPQKTAIYVAPTNALITQQTVTAEKFVIQAGLPHVVKAASAQEIKNWPDHLVGSRKGEKLYNVLRNPATIFPEVGGNKPLLLVTNPDIFYYATFFAYNQLDRSNIASQFYSQFSTVIFDEFHLYDAKQLVSLLFYLTLSQVFGFFDHGRKVVLLTATPDKACEVALETLAKQGVKIAKIDGENYTDFLLPSQSKVHLEIKPQLEWQEWLTELADQVENYIQERPTENGAVILDSKYLVNRLADQLKSRGLQNQLGRITGSTPFSERQIAAQKQIILATSTVDVGFNFEKHPAPTRQNLDWLIFSAKDRFSFWQRIGRVGRVLGKTETEIPSTAIAYLPAKAWEQGIMELEVAGGRLALSNLLASIPCLERPFLEIYWRSEAFLEIAKPLLELEEVFENLPQIELISQLYQSMQSLLGGKRDWHYYRYRMKALKGAESIANASIKKIQKEWQYLKGGQAFLKTYLQYNSPEEWENFQAGKTNLETYRQAFKQHSEYAEALKEFAQFWQACYAPIFQFRESLFGNLKVSDPKGFLVDESTETLLDPFHLFRYFEFIQEGDFIELTHWAEPPYEISFRLRYPGDVEEFKNHALNKLGAWQNCTVERRLGRDGPLVPTPLLKQLEKQWLPGLIIASEANQWVIILLRKQGVPSYQIVVSCNDFEKNYTFFPGLGGILALAMYGVRIKLADDEDFYIA